MVNQIVGNDGSNSLQGGNEADLIYGFDPNGSTSSVSSISAVRVATGLDQPVAFVAAPGDRDHMFIVERAGIIKVLDLRTGSIGTILDISSTVTTIGEGGLLGLAFDPGYAQNGFFYVNFTNLSDDTVIRRYQQPAAGTAPADPASGFDILQIDQPFGRTNHKGGWLGFGPDGYLYIPTGDGGGGGDPDRNAQNPASLLGKMLRIDVRSDAFPTDAARNYAIPVDNPFVGTAGIAPEIWALGLRNPFRVSFDRALETLFIGDVGQNRMEEVDIGVRGANYGWNVFEGTLGFQAGALGPGTLAGPIHAYDRSVGGTVIGGYVYRGESDGLQGQYFFADFVANKLFTLGTTFAATERTGQVVPNAGSIDMPTSFGEDALGNLYLVDLEGDIFRLTPNASSADLGDVLQGLGGNDIIHAGTGNDTLIGGSGNDALYGGAGADVATFAGSASQYSVTSPGNTVVVSDSIAGRDGIDTLIGVERLRFSDKLLAIDIAGNAGQVYRLYQAAFDRTPDRAGLSYWVNDLDHGADLASAARGFMASNEFKAAFGDPATLSASAFVDILYANVLHRAPDAAGKAYWLNQINQGFARERVLASFSESAENVAIVGSQIANGIELDPAWMT
jgi:glucose/arabinose dehydrogenase